MGKKRILSAAIAGALAASTFGPAAADEPFEFSGASNFREIRGGDEDRPLNWPVGDTFGIGAKGSFGDISVGLGYQDNDVADAVGLSVGASLGDIDAVVNYWTADVGGVDVDYTALGLTYTSGALGLHVNYGQFDTAGADADGVGVAVNYDLGGGAEVQFGYGDGEGTTTWSLGVAMSF